MQFLSKLPKMMFLITKFRILMIDKVIFAFNNHLFSIKNAFWAIENTVFI